MATISGNQTLLRSPAAMLPRHRESFRPANYLFTREEYHHGSGGGSSSHLGYDVTALPASFTTVTLRIPHAIRGASGGAILSGPVGNPYTTIDGEIAIHTFEAADMVLTDNSSAKRRYYAGP
jgi:hypothetical protein